MQDLFDALMQKGRIANKANSGHRPDHSQTTINHQANESKDRVAAARPADQAYVSPSSSQSKQLEVNEARRRAAAAAENRQRLSSLNKQQSHTTNTKQQQDESRAEQQAWRDRALATKKTSPFKTTKRAPASILSKISADAKRNRERRARELKARNEHMRAATDDDATDYRAQREAKIDHAQGATKPCVSLRANEAHDEFPNGDAKPQAIDKGELILEPSIPPEGPFSLNSKAGIEAVRKTIARPMVLPYDDVPSTTAAQRFMGKKPPKISFKKAKANPENQRITAHDLHLYQWRQQKRSWADVIQLYADMTDTAPRSEHVLRTRYRHIEKAINRDNIPEDICQRVCDGDEEAEKELNRLVNLQEPEPLARLNTVQPVPFKKTTNQDRATAALSTAPTPAPRPTQGGKSFDSDAYLALLSQAQDVWKADSEDDGDTARYSPPRDEDCVHWEYFMQRRDFTASDLAEHDFDMLDEEVEWREYTAGFGNVADANAEASRFVLAAADGSEAVAAADEANLHWKRTQEENMIAYNLTAPAGGMVQVRVQRRLLTFQHHVMPESKEGWMARTGYCVWVKQVKKTVAGEDLFTEPEIQHYLLDDHAYGSLEQANSRAMDEWVKLTTKIRSINLDEITRKRGEIKQELQRKFEDESEGDERMRFKASMDDDERTVEVSVAPLKWQGPRN